jgi:hypothetical protein
MIFPDPVRIIEPGLGVLSPSVPEDGFNDEGPDTGSTADMVVMDLADFWCLI